MKMRLCLHNGLPFLVKSDLNMVMSNPFRTIMVLYITTNLLQSSQMYSTICNYEAVSDTIASVKKPIPSGIGYVHFGMYMDNCASYMVKWAMGLYSFGQT